MQLPPEVDLAGVIELRRVKQLLPSFGLQLCEVEIEPAEALALERGADQVSRRYRPIWL